MNRNAKPAADGSGPEVTDPNLDPRAFRRCLGQFPTGVTVVTTAVERRQVGVTANSFASLSLDPPLVLWSISRASRSFPAFAEADHFTINILATDQIDLAQRFSSPAEDKFAGTDFAVGVNGAAIFPGAAGYLECSCEAKHPGGDHLIMVGRVERFAFHPAFPLAFAQGRYAVTGTHPALGSVTADTVYGPSYSDANRLSGLIFQAHRASWLAFDLYRNEEALTFPQGMILFAIWHEALPVTTIAERVLIPAYLVADECKALAGRGLVSTDMERRMALTEAGRQLRERIRRRALAFEAEQLKKFEPSQVEAARGFLRAYTQEIFRVAGRNSELARPPRDAAGE